MLTWCHGVGGNDEVMDRCTLTPNGGCTKRPAEVITDTMAGPDVDFTPNLPPAIPMVNVNTLDV